MAVGSRPFAYNPGAPIAGTTQVGDLAVGTPTNGFASTGLEWWNGPGEGSGWIIARPVPGDTQPTPVEYRTYLDPSHKGSNIILGALDQRASQANGSQQSVLGLIPINQGDKVMFSVLVEVTIGHPTQTDHVIGIGYQNMNYEGSPLGGWPGNDNLSIGYCSNGIIYNSGNQIGAGATWSDGDIIDIVINTQTAGMFTRVNGGDWDNDPTHDPVNSPSNAGAEIFNGPFYPVLCPEEGGSMKFINSTTYSVPTGYKFLGDITASVGFLRSDDFTAQSFINLVNNKFSQNFTTDGECYSWLSINGYWTSYQV